MKMNSFWGLFEEDSLPICMESSLSEKTMTKMREEPDQDFGNSCYLTIPVQSSLAMKTLTEVREEPEQDSCQTKYATIPIG